jgi:hypothetical protein
MLHLSYAPYQYTFHLCEEEDLEDEEGEQDDVEEEL